MHQPVSRANVQLDGAAKQFESELDAARHLAALERDRAEALTVSLQHALDHQKQERSELESALESLNLHQASAAARERALVEQYEARLAEARAMLVPEQARVAVLQAQLEASEAGLVRIESKAASDLQRERQRAEQALLAVQFLEERAARSASGAARTSALSLRSEPESMTPLSPSTELQRERDRANQAILAVKFLETEVMRVGRLQSELDQTRAALQALEARMHSETAHALRLAEQQRASQRDAALQAERERFLRLETELNLVRASLQREQEAGRVAAATIAQIEGSLASERSLAADLSTDVTTLRNRLDEVDRRHAAELQQIEGRADHAYR